MKKNYCARNFSFSCCLKLLFVVCKACFFTAVSSEVFDLLDHCKLFTVTSIIFLLYAEA